jgi:Tetratricopeptide repeat
VTPTRRPSLAPRRLVAAVGIGVVVASAAIGGAALLDEPAQRSAQDAAQPIIVGAVAGQEIPGTPTDVAGGLPPIGMVLDRPAPNGISALEPSVRVARLREITSQPGAAARRWVELGHAYQALGDSRAADAAYREAIRREPTDTAGRVGRAMVAGAQGAAGLRSGATMLDALVKDHPRDQLVIFNRGWLALYQRDVPTILSSWRQTVKLAPTTLLGRTATGLLREINANASGGAATPSP